MKYKLLLACSLTFFCVIVDNSPCASKDRKHKIVRFQEDSWQLFMVRMGRKWQTFPFLQNDPTIEKAWKKELWYDRGDYDRFKWLLDMKIACNAFQDDPIEEEFRVSLHAQRLLHETTHEKLRTWLQCDRQIELALAKLIQENELKQMQLEVEKLKKNRAFFTTLVGLAIIVHTASMVSQRLDKK